MEHTKEYSEVYGEIEKIVDDSDGYVFIPEKCRKKTINEVYPKAVSKVSNGHILFVSSDKIWDLLSEVDTDGLKTLLEILKDCRH